MSGPNLIEVHPVPPRPLRIFGRKSRFALDMVLAASVCVVACFNLYSGFAMLLVGLAQSAPLFYRRRWPVAVFTIVAAASAIQVFLSHLPAPSQIAFPIALYSIARFSRPQGGWYGLGVGVVAAWTAAIDWTAFNANTSFSVTGLLFLVTSLGAIVLTSWALGVTGRQRDDYSRWLLERGERMAEASAQQAQIAAAQERVRIAREMHDVVAHGLSVMVVQADGARYAATEHPEVAVQTLARISSTGREALDEMRRLLGLLRGDDGASELAPQPTLADLHSLVEQSADLGMQITAELPDPSSEIAASTALTVYRVVQEALTNIRKHAGESAHVTVSVGLHANCAIVSVVDDGFGAAATSPAGGFGLIGMRERVELHGGTLDVGPAPGGGWRVDARIPR